jgi:CRP-like cAMP-binding protein
MTTTESAALVKRLQPPFLDGLTPSEMGIVLAAARHRKYLANSVITNQGHPASHMYMVLTGSARSFFLTQAGQKLHVHWYPPGEMFGGMAMIPRASEYIVSTEAVKTSHVLILERATIRGLTARFPRLLDNALMIAADYLNSAIATQVALSCHTARQRLAEALVNLASGTGHRVTAGIELRVRNEELAAVASVTPFTASRVMSEWQRSGVVAKSRGKVVLRSPERLLMQEL